VDALGPAPPVWPSPKELDCDLGIQEHVQLFAQLPPCLPKLESPAPSIQAPVAALESHYPILENPLSEPQFSGARCKDEPSLYVQRTNWQAAFTKLVHWRAIQECTYLPNTLTGTPMPVQIQLQTVGTGGPPGCSHRHWRHVLLMKNSR
jgi:hypothetical protein